MAKQKPIDREKQKQVQELEALLRASANSASKVVSSWLPDDNDDGSDTEKKPSSTAALKPRDVFKGRPARLGVGAKFLSHKEMMSSSQSGPGILSAEELRLKRKLTKGIATLADGKNTLTEKRKSIDDDDEADDLDSRSRIVGSSGSAQAAKSSPATNPSPHSHPPSAANMATKKKSKTSLFLDSLIKRRKK
ncbi:hypothetical protein GGF44_001257 [Coemansia sp. RSA 1694]|nr:hypothetical protein GGF44_001257 [Coemansia sp. RSA 1694]